MNKQRGLWLRSAVLGLDDGLVTTLIFIATAASITPKLFLVVLANVLAGAIAMTLGSYLSAKTSHEVNGHDGGEYHPWLQGMQVGAAFVVGGTFPTLPVLFGATNVVWWSYGCTAVISVALGILKTHYTGRHPIRSAIEFLAVVTIGALVGVLAGSALGNIS